MDVIDNRECMTPGALLDEDEFEKHAEYELKMKRESFDATYRDNLVELQRMGFCDFEKNLKALQKSENDL